MRAKQTVLKAYGGSLAAALIVVCCAHASVTGMHPNTRRLVLNGQEVEVETGIDDAPSIADQFTREGMPMSGLWRVPGQPTMRLAIVERPAAEAAYGPQLVAFDVSGAVRVLHESGRLYDDNFVHPTFFSFSDRTLILADHGSEDAYGMLAWSVENGSVRDLGQLQIALPGETDMFTRGAASTARVHLKDGKYVITIPGPVLLNPQGEDERQLAKKGEIVTFRESAGHFEVSRQ